MNARDYLQKQGWQGDGHSLDSTGRGIKKPLLISKKVDVLGVGLNKHAAVSDQWWLRAFDQSLKDFGSGKESMLATVQKHGVNRGGLYGRFVQGESIAGTFDDTPQTSAPSTPPSTTEGGTTRKRKRSHHAVSKSETSKGARLPVADELPASARSLPPAKLDQYRERAKQKGISIEQYTRRREAKKKAKREGKKSAKASRAEDTVSKSKPTKTRREKSSDT